MNSGNITISAEVDEEMEKIIERGLSEYNESQCGPDPSKPLWVICRDEDGNISGGLQDFTQWDWFVVTMLWVREDNRNQGMGSKLLAESENAARERGCARVRLATFTFQAPKFYKKFGYVEMCRLPDVPPGHSFIWLAKNLPA